MASALFVIKNDKQGCFEKAVKNRGLERSFKMAIPKEVYESLKKEMEQIDEQK